MLFNHGAGHGASLAALRDTLARAGHELVRVIDHKDDAQRVWQSRRRSWWSRPAATARSRRPRRRWRARDVPLAILPLGTANNIAFTLGVDGSDEQLAADGTRRGRGRSISASLRWRLGQPPLRRRRRRRPRRGVHARHPSSGQSPDEPPPWQLVRALRRYTDALARLEPRPWVFRWTAAAAPAISCWSKCSTGARSVPTSSSRRTPSPFDGRLAVVTARAEHREVLAAYLADRLSGRESAAAAAGGAGHARRNRHTPSTPCGRRVARQPRHRAGLDRDRTFRTDCTVARAYRPCCTGVVTRRSGPGRLTRSPTVR